MVHLLIHHDQFVLVVDMVADQQADHALDLLDRHLVEDVLHHAEVAEEDLKKLVSMNLCSSTKQQ